jgi:hypothetical protein
MLVTTEVRRERIETCLSCDRVIKPPQPAADPKNPIDWWFGIKCRVCKCGIRPKTMLELARCPLKKWKR